MPTSSDDREARVFGAVLMEQRRIMRRLVGDAVFDRGLTRVTAEQRSEYAALSWLSWCRASTATAVALGVAIEAGNSPELFIRDVVAGGFGVVLRTFWRVLMTNSSDEALMRRAGMIYNKAIDKGTLRVAAYEPGRIVLEVRDWPEIEDLGIVAVSAGVEAVLISAGRKDVRVESQRIAEGVQLTASTTPPRSPSARR